MEIIFIIFKRIVFKNLKRFSSFFFLFCFLSKAVNFIFIYFRESRLFLVYLSTRSPVAFEAFHSCLFISPFQFNCLLQVFKLLLISRPSTNLKYRWLDRWMKNIILITNRYNFHINYIKYNSGINLFINNHIFDDTYKNIILTNRPNFPNKL